MDTKKEEKEHREDIEEKLKMLKRKKLSDEKIEEFQNSFEEELIHYVSKANKRRTKQRMMKRYLSLGIAFAIILALMFPVKTFLFKKKVEHIVYSDPHLAYLYDKGMGRPSEFRYIVRKTVIDKKLQLLYIYVRIQRTVILYDLKENKIIGTAECRLHTDREETIVAPTTQQAEEAKQILQNDPFVKRLKVSSITVRKTTTVFHAIGKDNLHAKNIILADITLKDGHKFTAAVDLYEKRVLDISDVPNIHAEFFASKKTSFYKEDVHFLLYKLKDPNNWP